MTETRSLNLELLIKLLKMTASENDSEALLAMRKANAQLSKVGGDWDNLLRGKVTLIADPFMVAEPQWRQPAAAPPPPPPPPPHYAAPPPPPPPRYNPPPPRRPSPQFTQKPPAQPAPAAAPAKPWAPASKRKHARPTTDDIMNI